MAAGGTCSSESTSLGAPQSIEQAAVIENVWTLFDTDGSGDVDSRELQAMVCRISSLRGGSGDVPREDIDALMRYLDSNGDGILYKSEFVNALRQYLRRGLPESPHHSRKRPLSESEESQARPRRRVYDQISSLFHLSQATMSQEARLRVAMASVQIESSGGSRPRTRFERLSRVAPEAAERAQNLLVLQKFLSSESFAERTAITAALLGSMQRPVTGSAGTRKGSLDTPTVRKRSTSDGSIASTSSSGGASEEHAGHRSQLSAARTVCRVLDAAQKWSSTSSDLRVQYLALQAYDYIADAKLVSGLASILAKAYREPAWLREPEATETVVLAANALRLYARGPVFARLPPSSRWHFSRAWRLTRKPLLRDSRGGSSGSVAALVTSLATTCARGAVRRECFRLLSSLASYAGDGAPDFRGTMTRDYTLAAVCCGRLEDADPRRHEPILNREAISECLAVMCGHGHGTPPFATTRKMLDSMGGEGGARSLARTIIGCFKRDFVEAFTADKPDRLAAACKHNANLCEAFVHVLPSVVTAAQPWTVLLDLAKPRFTHMENQSVRKASYRLLSSALGAISSMLVDPSDELSSVLLGPTKELPRGLVHDLLLPVLSGEGTATDTKLEALSCGMVLAKKSRLRNGIDPRLELCRDPAMLRQIAIAIESDPELRHRALVLVKELSVDDEACARLVAANAIEAVAASLRFYRRKDHDVIESLGVNVPVCDPLLASNALAALQRLLGFIMSRNPLPSPGNGATAWPRSSEARRLLRLELVSSLRGVLEAVVAESVARKRPYTEGRGVSGPAAMMLQTVGQYLQAITVAMPKTLDGREAAKAAAAIREALGGFARATKRLGSMSSGAEPESPTAVVRKPLSTTEDSVARLDVATYDKEILSFCGTYLNGTEVSILCTVVEFGRHSNSLSFRVDPRVDFDRFRDHIERLFDYRGRRAVRFVEESDPVLTGSARPVASTQAGGGGGRGVSFEPASEAASSSSASVVASGGIGPADGAEGSSAVSELRSDDIDVQRRLQLSYSDSSDDMAVPSPSRPIRNDRELAAAMDFAVRGGSLELHVFARSPFGNRLRAARPERASTRSQLLEDGIMSALKHSTAWNSGSHEQAATLELETGNRVHRVVDWFRRKRFDEIRPSTFGDFLQMAGVRGITSADKARALFAVIDTDGSNSLSVAEVLMWAAVRHTGSYREKIFMAFMAADTDRDGTIGRKELSNMLMMGTGSARDKPTAGRLADSIIQAFDKDGNRVLDLLEFEMAALSFPELTSLFTGEDSSLVFESSGEEDGSEGEEDSDDEEEEGSEEAVASGGKGYTEGGR